MAAVYYQNVPVCNNCYNIYSIVGASTRHSHCIGGTRRASNFYPPRTLCLSVAVLHVFADNARAKALRKIEARRQHELEARRAEALRRAHRHGRSHRPGDGRLYGSPNLLDVTSFPGADENSLASSHSHSSHTSLPSLPNNSHIPGSSGGGRDSRSRSRSPSAFSPEALSQSPTKRRVSSMQHFPWSEKSPATARTPHSVKRMSSTGIIGHGHGHGHGHSPHGLREEWSKDAMRDLSRVSSHMGIGRCVPVGGGGGWNHTQGLTAPAAAAGLLIHSPVLSPFPTSPPPNFGRVQS